METGVYVQDIASSAATAAWVAAARRKPTGHYRASQIPGYQPPDRSYFEHGYLEIGSGRRGPRSSYALSSRRGRKRSAYHQTPLVLLFASRSRNLDWESSPTQVSDPGPARRPWRQCRHAEVYD